MATLNYITNGSQLKLTIDNILDNVLNKVSEILLNDFREHLDHTVYKPARSEYHRYYKRGGFYSGWQIENSHKYIRKLMFDGNKLIAPSQDGKNGGMAHGGRNGEDIRDMIAGVLNDIDWNDYFSCAGGAKYLTTRDQGYWDVYMRDIDKKIEKWLDDEFKKYGISRGR